MLTRYFFGKLKANFCAVLRDKRGDGPVNIILGILIAVVLAGIVLGLISAYLPTLWTNITSAIDNLFTP